jgi:alkylated DNA repair dioxygenase AlkB
MNNCLEIGGLRYVANYVDALTESALIAAIDDEQWLSDLTRRVRHYGYRYDYRRRKIDASLRLGSLPRWTTALVNRLRADGHITGPDQLIVNEYLPGQGISPHIDCVGCFGPIVCSISLGSSCVMRLSAVKGGRREILLERGSLLVLSGESRFAWRHSIPARKCDTWEGRSLERGRRVSLTFRTVVLESSSNRGSRG